MYQSIENKIEGETILIYYSIRLTTNILVVSQYEIYKNKLIGEGQYGRVYVCKDTCNPNLKLCAKIIEDKIQDPKTGREMELMQMIMEQGRNNKHTVGVYHVDVYKSRIILILEICECDLQMKFKERRLNDKYNRNKLILIIVSRNYLIRKQSFNFKNKLNIQLYYIPEEAINILK
ncbi:unnamed protein product [Paramecium octaurelia]|uniref:Protein kinase domain-containing protein n=1 Tax=Paramecium octaurelia TaxID=43137 RepID=A0A8S1YMS7_PAROT|nr:unnamed protein product [Paramecium octaurelia]